MHLIYINKSLVGIFAGLVILIFFLFTLLNPLYFLILPAIAIISFNLWKKIWQPLLLLSAYLLISVLTVFILDRFYFNDFFPHSYSILERFIPIYLFALLFLTVPFYLLFRYYIKLTGIPPTLKNNNSGYSKHPYLVCTDHYTRTKTVAYAEYHVQVMCRKGFNCASEKKLTYARNIIGLIGKSQKSKKLSGNYYISLWDYKERKIIDADYDIIEIYENDLIEDYNFVITKVIDFFYKELERYKPIFEMKVKIFGKPDFSENTKRLLEKHFLKVEYLKA